MQVAEDSHDFLAGLAVQVAGGFIRQDNGRILGQSPGYRHSLLLAPGQFVRAVFDTVGQAYFIQGFSG